jgi:hypothetical protein
MHPPSSSVRILQAKVPICQQIFVSIIIRRVHHVPFTSLIISRLRTGSPCVAICTDTRVRLNVATLSYKKKKTRQMLVCCVVSVLAPMLPYPKAWVCSRSLAGTAGSNPAEGMNVFSSECCVLSGRGLCVGLITCQEESYRVWCA